MSKFWLFTPSAANTYRVGSMGVRAAVVVADDADAARAALTAYSTSPLKFGAVAGEIHAGALDLVSELTADGDNVALFAKGGRLPPSGPALAIGDEN